MGRETRPYRPGDVEPKWQAVWEKEDAYRAVDEHDGRPRYYALDMFPYPSGDLHMGHAEAFGIGDVLPRYKWMRGFNVLHPIGWDAFGLPAENAALKRGVHPKEWTFANVEQQRKTFRRYGMSFDWSRQFNTCDPDYYRWTQWLFLELYRAGLAYRKLAPANWCPTDQTVLANEQVVQGRCERCGTPVVRRDLTQWFFRITAYADRLLDDMDQLSGWPERVLTMQRNWIGRSHGAEVTFEISETGDRIPVFTTRPDTLWGVTFFVFSPEHPLVGKLAEVGGVADEVRALQDRLQSLPPDQREEQAREGIPLGVHAVNPVTGERVPAFVAPYVLMEYGTGAIMGVPAHDQRDFEFARAHDLEIRVVIQPDHEVLEPDAMGEAFPGVGVMVRSGPFDGSHAPGSIQAVIEWLEARGIGRASTSYRLRDWLISRQRYWGAPIPIIHCPTCGEVPVPEGDLPVVLPDDVDFSPQGTSPLAKHPAFTSVRCPSCGSESARRETDTMDTFVDSSWYFLRFCSPDETSAPFQREDVERWCPVEHYTGGIEHAILHLLYARFVTKALYDLDRVTFTEPFTSLLNQGMVLYEGEVFSKSRGGGIAPAPLIERWGADTVRLTMMFAGPVEDDIDWAAVSEAGVHKWLKRVWRVVHEVADSSQAAARSEAERAEAGRAGGVGRDEGLGRLVHRTVKEVTGFYDRFRLNLVIARLMVLTSELQAVVDAGDTTTGEVLHAAETLVLLLAPMAPHIAEELWRETLGHPETIVHGPWPAWDEELARDQEVVLVVQVDGKVRDRLTVPASIGEDEARELALSSDRVRGYLGDRSVARVVVRPPRLVNVVTAPR